MINIDEYYKIFMEGHNKILVITVITLLIMWLIFRMIRNKIRSIIKKEIYNNFPAIKDEIKNLEHRVDYLRGQLELLERKTKEK